ncbi:MAG: dihydroxy-acid dehydratase [Rhodospirillaceae bacterium TMED8]|nr:dihydroxy-acid dehydratase [Magnetovibrio sp.]OUT51902.1 MAG: dihydroxy-acid dehydratase [Rhodospirillaceae bacterium TMED8]|tara:strand:- start:3698 stop:5548 length:1851 start_codon:yes stop_codon:yes gene_type:complete
MNKSNAVLIDRHPGRSTQTIGIARKLNTDTSLVHEPSIGVIGTKGDSQCYLGVTEKVDAIHAQLWSRIGSAPNQLQMRLIQPEYTIATSDGIRNGTPEMRYSLIGREVTNDALCEHLEATGLAGIIAVVACDKPPVGALAAILEHNEPAIIMSDGAIHPGKHPDTGEALDIVSAYQVAGHPDKEHQLTIAVHACPGIGSCGGMFTYNTMQTFIGIVGMQPLHMVAPSSDDLRRIDTFPRELIAYLESMMVKRTRPRDIVVRDSIRNGVIVAMAIGGSTNVVLHAPEIARAAGYENFWRDIITPEEFNHLSQNVIPVITNARPYGLYSMVDIDRIGGIPVIASELLDAGLLNGDVMTCTGESLSDQVNRLGNPRADGNIVYSVESPFKPTGGLRILGGNLSPDFSAVLKLAGVEGGLENNVFEGRARVFERESRLLEALDKTPDAFENNDIVIVRYEGPSGAPGMPEMLDSTSRITALCRERGIIIALMTDGRFSGGSVGLVIGHVGPEAALGGPIALIENNDKIVADLNTNQLNCLAFYDPAILRQRRTDWEKIVANNGGVHPHAGVADTRLLHRARHSAVPAIHGGGMHPDRKLWVRSPREVVKSHFIPKNRFKA